MKKYIVLTAEAFVQIVTMIAFYPVLVAMAVYAGKYIRYGYTYVCGIPIFLAWNRRWLPMLRLNWHYYA